MTFSDYDVTRRTRKGNFLKQIDQLIDWSAIEQAIAVHCAPISDAAGRSAYSGLLLFKMLLVGIWNGVLSDESVEDMANSNLHVMRFLGLSLEDDVPDHSVLSRFRTRLTAANTWDGLLEQINRQIQTHNITVRKGCHVDASITQSPRNLRPELLMKWSAIGKNGMMKRMRKQRCESLKLLSLSGDSEAHWVSSRGKSVFGYKQHAVVDANCHDSKPLLSLLDKANIQRGACIHADKAYSSQKHRDALKSCGIKNGIQDKVAKNNPLTHRQLQRNSLITKARYVVECTFGSQARWFNAKILCK